MVHNGQGNYQLISHLETFFWVHFLQLFALRVIGIDNDGSIR